MAYDGTNYHGWQVQENAHTVQAEVQDAISAIFKQKAEVTGCGRTDTGVHAKEFYAHFETEERCEEKELQDKLNSFLPTDIGVHDVFEVPSGAHARYDATSRTYEYHITREKSPFKVNRSWYLYGELDESLMTKPTATLLAHEDFSSFCKSRTQVKTNICRITHAEWKNEEGMLLFTITADRFLRNMVRAIVGTLVEIGQGKRSADDFGAVIESKDRTKAGLSAPAEGLFLVRVEYPKEIMINAKS